MAEKHFFSMQDLRARAEKKLKEYEVKTSAPPSSEEAHRLIHELQVHQIELEMQNEELRRVQAELEASHERYFDLYDLAPVGYLTMNEKGLILEANITAAGLLGMEKGILANQLLAHFISPEDQDAYYQHRKQLVKAQAPQKCDLRMRRKDGVLFWAHMSFTILDSGNNQSGSKVILSDITERKQLEQERERLIAELQKAVSEIKTIKGLIPICSSCKKIKNDGGSWEAIEKYFLEHTDILFSHGLCDDCLKQHYPNQYDRVRNDQNRQ